MSEEKKQPQEEKLNEEQSNQEESAPDTTEAEIQIDETKMEELQTKISNEQNMSGALFAGFAASLIGAAIWALVTAVTEYQIGFMAVGVGFLVGYAVRMFGKGVDKVYGFIGAAFALFGCIAGNYFTVIYFTASYQGVAFWDLAFGLELPVVIDIMIETFQPMDLLFYGLAVYEGYKFSFRQLSEDEIAEVMK